MQATKQPANKVDDDDAAVSENKTIKVVGLYCTSLIYVIAFCCEFSRQAICIDAAELHSFRSKE